jgi:DNA-binding NtrC family response regulator
MTYNILLVDDDLSDVNLLKNYLEKRMDCRAVTIDNGKQAVDVLTATKTSPFDLVLLDLAMPGVSGIDVLNAARPIHPKLPVIVRTGKDGAQDAVEALKAGATDFINKTDSPSAVEKAVKAALLSSKLEQEMARYHDANSHRKTGFSDILGESRLVKDMIAYAKKAAESDIPVLIEGESGCGKELLARAVHNNSRRADKPFITVNCGAIPENLVESTLFGHEKGAFTGAIYKAIGKFREADGGTIFLDEVGELKLETQTKLLRALQNGEVDPVGGAKHVKVDVRVISATNRDLMKEVERKAFREDLYYRLNVFPLRVPALRERHGDVPILVRYYVGKFSQAEEKFVHDLPQDTMRLLESYSWPGNIRQLKNVIYRAVVLSDSPSLETAFFPQVTEGLKLSGKAAEDASPFLQLTAGDAQAGVAVVGPDGHVRNLEDIEKDAITKAMQRYHGCISEAARRLGLGRSTLYRKMHKYAIDQMFGLDEGAVS